MQEAANLALPDAPPILIKKMKELGGGDSVESIKRRLLAGSNLSRYVVYMSLPY